VLVSLCFLAGLVPPLTASGVGLRDLVAGVATGDLGWIPDLESWSRTAGQDASALLLALAATLLFWLLGALVHCFVEGGILGVLVAGDRQAAPGARRQEWFRTYSRQDLLGWGRRLLPRMLGLWVVGAGLCLLWVMASAGWIGLAVWGLRRWGGLAGGGIGCGGALPILFGWIVLFLWWQLALALLAERDALFWPTLARAARLVGHRLWGLLLILLVLLAAGLAVNVVFMPLSVGIDLALAGQPRALLVAGSLLGLAQWLAGSVLAVSYSASVVALTRAQLRATAGAAP
jgi:hypothetical protein